MADVKDILGVPRSSGLGKSDTKKEKERIQRPAGMSREAFALLDGSHPIVPSLAGDLRKKNDQGFKQKRKSSSKGQVCTPAPAYIYRLFFPPYVSLHVHTNQRA